MDDDNPAATGGDDAELYRHELDRLRRAALELRRAYHDQERALAQAQRDVSALEERYARLRRRRSVRTLLAAARLARPLIAAVRRLRRTPAGGATRPGGAGGAGGAGVSEAAPGRPGDRRGPAAPDEPQRFRAELGRKLRGEAGARLVVDVAGSAELAGALGRLGYDARATASGLAGAGEPADLMVVTDPGADLRAVSRRAVLAGLALDRLDAWTAQPWFDDLDVVLVADDRDAEAVAAASAKAATPLAGREAAEALRDALVAWCRATRFSLAVATPSWDVAERWGDTHYGRALQRQLERRGHPARLYLRDEFAAADVARADVALHLLGLATPKPHPGQVNVLWVISHPEAVDGALCAPYDLVLTASERFAAQLTPLVEAPVLALPQATDAERFRPDASGPAHDLLFVGNSRRTRRTIIDDLTPTRHDLAVYGGDWTPDLLDPRHLRGAVVPNAQLHRYYASAKIVLNDHWPEMAALGFVSNRIYDALAAGALVVSDEVAGLDRLFDGAVVTYRGPDDLRASVDRLLADPDARRELAARGRRVVLERHTFAHRTDRLLELLAPFVAARGGAREGARGGVR